MLSDYDLKGRNGTRRGVPIAAPGPPIMARARMMRRGRPAADDSSASHSGRHSNLFAQPRESLIAADP